MTVSVKLACAIAAAGAAGVGLFAPGASAAGNSGSAAGVTIPIGSFPGAPPAGCPSSVSTDNFVLSFVSGTINKSGETVEGDASLVDATTSTTLDFGHTTLWGNQKNFTLTFHGQGVVFHVTANSTHGVQVARMSCS